jgi:hypothetical protein
VFDDRGPGGVELARWSGGASPGDAIGLLDQRDADPFRPRDVRRRHKVSRSHPSTGSVTEDQRRPRLIGRMQVGVRLTMRGVHFEDRDGSVPLRRWGGNASVSASA